MNKAMAVALLFCAGIANATPQGNPNGNPPPFQEGGSSSNNNDNSATGVGVGVGLGVGLGGEGGDADADADATAIGVGLGGEGGDAYSGSYSEGGDADSYSRSTSDADADANSNSYSGSASQAVASGNGGDSRVSVQGGSTTYNSESRALALSLPGATPGVGASAPCLVTTRGVTAVGVGASGNTKIDSTCYNDLQIQKMFENCMYVADSYVKLGLIGEARDQMEACRVLAIKRIPAKQ